MKLKLLLNLSVTDFPAPEGEAPYMDGDVRNIPDSMARLIVAKGWGVPVPADPVPAQVQQEVEAAKEEAPKDKIVSSKVKDNPPVAAAGK